MKNIISKSIFVVLFSFIFLSSLQAGQIGYYFGTFDPIHKGHIGVALSAVKHLKLDKLYILPNYVPSGKPNASSFDDRYNMVSLIVARHKNLDILPKDKFEIAYEEGGKKYIPLLMTEVMKSEGKDNQYFHICGTDSFSKMAKGNYFPLKGENRIIVVMKRTGYETPKNKSIEQLKENGQLRFFDPQIQKISSTKIRTSFKEGRYTSEAELPIVVRYYIQKHGLYGASKPALSIPPKYRSRIIGVSNKKKVKFHPKSLVSLVSIKSLLEEPSIDVDKYLEQKIPTEIIEWIVTRNAKVTLVGGIWTDALGYLAQKGFQKVQMISATDRNKVHCRYVLAQEGKQAHLFVTNFFGNIRLNHLTLQYCHLMYRNFGNLDNLRVVLQKNYPALSKILCHGSLRKLSDLSDSVICIGSHGALKHVLESMSQISQSQLNFNFLKLDVSKLNSTKYLEIANRPQRSKGNRYFPYWEYTLETANKNLNLIAFHNLYGDQIETVIKLLLNKGAKRFLVLGNCGALKVELLNKLVAPSSILINNELLLLSNNALNKYKPVSVKPVDSILEESIRWLGKLKNSSAIDVETKYIRSALLGGIKTSLYLALFVTDIPKEHGIDIKQENSELATMQKRKFWLEALQWIFRKTSRK